jgi:hypothetical protein
MRAVLMIIEFADAYNLTEIIFRFENIVIQDELNIVYRTVIEIFPVASLIDTVEPCFCQACLTNISIAVNEGVSRTQEAIIMKCDNSRKFLFSEHRQDGSRQSTFIKMDMCHIWFECLNYIL